ncbi:MAG: hypothetical protein QM784_17555 [Polyangiaceae bacterium]
MRFPPDSSRISAPNTAALWGVVDGRLLSWDESSWTITELPRESRARNMTWTSVWRRGATDIWLVGMSPSDGSAPPRYFLFNTADGSATAPLPKVVEHDPMLGAPNERDLPVTCAHPFADLLKLTPFQLGFDSTIRMSEGEARAALALVLSKRPSTPALTFVRHGCYGEDCIGAVVEAQREADELRRELTIAVSAVLSRRKTSKLTSDGPPATWLIADSHLRCLPPPETSPFVVPR